SEQRGRIVLLDDGGSFEGLGHAQGRAIVDGSLDRGWLVRQENPGAVPQWRSLGRYPILRRFRRKGSAMDRSHVDQPHRRIRSKSVGAVVGCMECGGQRPW